MDFSEGNLRNRWLGVKSIWAVLHEETKQYVKSRLERALELAATVHVGCDRYERSSHRCGYRNGRYARDLLTSYGWIERLQVPRLRHGSVHSAVLERYRLDLFGLKWRCAGFCARVSTFVWIPRRRGGE